MKLIYFINVDWYFALHWQARCKAAQQAGFTVHLLTHFTRDDIRQQLVQAGVVCHDIPLVRNSFHPFSEFRLFFQVFQLIARLKPDLVHCVTIKPNIYGGLVCRFLDIVAVLSVTGRGAIFTSRSALSKLAKPCISLLYRLVGKGKSKKKILFENHDDATFFIEKGLVNQFSTRVIKGAGVDMDLFPYVELPHDDEPIVLFAARLLQDKGLALLIEATQLLRRQGVKFSLHVAGIIDTDSIDAIPLEQIEEWHVEGSIMWRGQCDDMAAVLAQSTIVVLPTSYGEGVPRILIEAAATGRPLVATDVPGCRDIVCHGLNGLLVPRYDAGSLAQALAHLLGNHTLCHKFGRYGREYVETEFGRDKVIRETLQVYQEFTQQDGRNATDEG